MRSLREFRQSLRQALADHELRHRPSRFGIALFDSIHFVPEDDWNAVVPKERLFLRRRYLAALEGSGSATLRHRYALLYDGRRPVAAAAMQVHELSGEAVGSRTPAAVPEDASLRDKVGRKVGAVLRRARDRVTLRVLVCGNVFVTGAHGFVSVPGLAAEDAFDGLADAIYRVRRADKLHGQISGVLVKDFEDGPLAVQARRLGRFGYREFAVDPQMVVVLRPEWSGFEDYVAAMGKKYRAQVRGARKKGAGLVRKAMSLQTIEARHGDVRRLFRAVHEKAGFRIAELPERYFQALAAGLPEEFSMHGYFLGDDPSAPMVGFTTCIRWGDALEGHYLGLDYEHNTAHAIYQNILYDDVQEAFDRRCRYVNLGRTALEIKSGIGAEPRPVSCFIRHRNPASNAVVKPLFGFVKPTAWRRRHPFGREDEG